MSENSGKSRPPEPLNFSNNDETAETIVHRAEQGHADAQYNLGIAFAFGEGVSQDDVEAVKWYRKAAEQGHAKAQNVLGVFYAEGRGVPRDYIKSVGWHRLAANQGNANAYFNLAQRYAFGQGLTRDARKAFSLYRVAAEAGLAPAQFAYAEKYALGEGTPQDYKEALHWYRMAAEQGNADAQCNIGNMYARGEGGVRDYKEAVFWQRKAAEQGHADAQYNLGIAFAFGEGVSQDDVEAVKWYRKAAEQGDADAQYNLGGKYARGEGVSLDNSQAVYWYGKAANQGDADAEREIDRLLANVDRGRENGSTVRNSSREEVTSKIKALVEGREITRLVHFTRCENLSSILQHGLLSVACCDAKKTRTIRNDTMRLDRRLHGISLSVTFPNYQMFYKYRQLDQDSDWAVLILPARILWQKKCGFFQHNAADSRMRGRPQRETANIEALRELFDDPNARRQDFLRPCDTTDPQAEVMVYEPIEPRLIEAIAFETKYVADEWSPVVGDRDTIFAGKSNGLFGSRAQFLDAY